MVEGNFALIKIEGKPAEALIEKISEAIGGLARPWQMGRVARAQADADKIAAYTEIEISEIRRRALNRFVIEEEQKQLNIEAITAKAIPLLEDKADPKSVENDWLSNFFDKCRLTTDSQMQELWSKVLAGQVNAPGRYSRRTVNFVASLDKSEADLFTRLCGFGDKGAIFVFNVSHSIYEERGINFVDLKHLESIGLISFEASGYGIERREESFDISYYGRVLKLSYPPSMAQRETSIGTVMLSPIGQQLAPISGSAPVPGFIDYLVGNFKTQGLICSSPIPQPSHISYLFH